MQLSARELAAFLSGTVDGDPEVVVVRPSKIEEGGEGTISFFGNPKYEDYVYQSTASILLVDKNFHPRQPIQPTLIRVEDVYASIAKLLDKFGQVSPGANGSGIPADASVHSSVRLGENISIGHFAVIEENTNIGAHTRIGAQVYIGPGTEIGEHTIIFPGVRILAGAKIGNHCIIHANVVIGADGFGFAPEKDGSYRKITHVGNVIIEDRVEIGANTTIDRATMGSTIIRKGAKLDNLIQVGHNVEIGEHTVIAAQTGIAGSTKIGSYCRIGGQVGFVGHITIADGVQIQAQSGIASAIKQPQSAWFGSPAIGYKEYLKSFAVFKQLPELLKRLTDLEKFTTSKSEEDGIHTTSQ